MENRGGAALERLACFPRSRHCVHSGAAVDEEFGFDARRFGSVQVAPAFFPDLRAAGTPPLIFSGQQQFQRFGKLDLPNRCGRQ
jgi:hypothetical protein